ncbi:MAG TPA: EF-hand domain-containing protein [Sphingomicrobium sp.]
MKKLMIAAGALLAGTAALAQTAPIAQPTPATPIVRPMQDNVMTRAEAVALAREHFGRIDADRDGSITTAEAIQVHSKLRGDRKAHRIERRLKRDPNEAFERLDADKNGAISREEFAKGREDRLERRIVMREERKDRKAAGEPHARPFRMHRGGFGDRMIVLADGNQDGRITLAEAEALALQHFDKMDSNKDGQVTREERRSGRPMKFRHVIEKKSAS